MLNLIVLFFVKVSVLLVRPCILFQSICVLLKLICMCCVGGGNNLYVILCECMPCCTGFPVV